MCFKNKFVSAIHLFMFFSSTLFSSEKATFFDFGEHDKDIYRPFFKIAEQCGLDIEHLPISKIIDSQIPYL